MNFKVYKKEQIVENKKTFYETPKLIRENGIYYIGYEDAKIQIEEWEAAEVYENPELVYDLIVSYRRKYYFNTAEDSIEILYH